MKKKRRKKKKFVCLRVLLLPLFMICIVLGAAHMADLYAMSPQRLLSDTKDYPQELLDALERNPDMLDFVKDYPEKKGTVSADTIGEVSKGEFPLLLQWDKRWGYGNYGESCIAVSGCAPTALSMVIAGLTGDNEVTPYTVASYAEENGYYVPGTGTSWSLMTDGSSHFGIKGTELSLTESSVLNALNSGTPIICSVRPGDFTTVGHFIVLVGTEDGKIRVNDPNSKETSSRLWDYDTLAPQIKNLWKFTI